MIEATWVDLACPYCAHTQPLMVQKTWVFGVVTCDACDKPFAVNIVVKVERVVDYYTMTHSRKENQ